MNRVSQALVAARRVEQPHSWGRVVWHVWGEQNPARPRLVLLHGGSGSWTHWVRNVLPLSETHEVWALDLPGFGDSDLPPGVIDADDLVPWLDEILAQRFGDQALTVIGFSFGGMTAGLLAAHNPTRMARLILVGVPGLGLFGKDLPMRGMQAGMTQAQQREVHRFNLHAMMIADGGTIDDELIDLQQANVARDRMRRRRIARTDVLLHAQPHWQCPVHGIWGGRDALYASTLEQVPRVLHRLASWHVIDGAGHWVQYEAPDAFHRALRALL